MPQQESGNIERISGKHISNRLLILACSRRKRRDPNPIPAIERYDGPMYKVYRKYARKAQPPATWIISAEHGLIPSSEPVLFYDRKMTPTRAGELQPQVSRTVETLKSESFDEVMLCASGLYTEAIGDLSNDFECRVVSTSGSVGRQIAMLHDWLNGSPPDKPAVPDRRPVLFRSQTIDISSDEVIRLALQKANDDPVGSTRFASWYVPVGDMRIAPKWLLSEITGIPVSYFRTADARRVLAAIGVEVYRA